MRARPLLGAATISMMLIAAAVFGQTEGVRGKAVDQDGTPVEGVDVLIEFLDGASRSQNTSSNEKGDFIQIGLRSGNYRITLRKSGYETAVRNVRISIGPEDIGRVVLEKLPEGTLSQDEIQKLNEEVQQQFDQGVAAVESEDYRAALDLFRSVVERDPDFAGAYFNLGFVYKKVGEMEKARSWYEKAAEIRPDYYEAWVEIGNLYNEDHEYGKSLEAFERAVAIRADEISTLYNYGAVAMNAGAMPKAREAFGKLLAIDSSHAMANYQMGMVMVNLGENDEAISYLERYLELDPEGSHAVTAKGVIDQLKQG